MDDEVWLCDFCDMEFTLEEEVKLHERICLHSDKKWKCTNCNRNFKNEYYQLKHTIGCKISGNGDSDSSAPVLSYLYKALVSSYHPDKTNSQPLKKIFHAIMLEVNDAYKKKDVKLLKEIQKGL